MHGAQGDVAIVLDYCGSRDKGASDFITSELAKGGARGVEVVRCADQGRVEKLRAQIAAIGAAASGKQVELVIDISVIPRADLWMLLRWLTEASLWDLSTFAYTEPEEYSRVTSLPLSCGLRGIETLVGEGGASDCSRPVHLMMQLGYEGDQALAVYEECQPARMSLMIPHPPFRSWWEGRTEEFNSHLLGLAAAEACWWVDPIDPARTREVVAEILGNDHLAEAVVLCPLGTKPQLLGLFSATFSLSDQPALLIPEPLRSASTARASGVGQSWIIK